jgi:hypothetical protein
LVVSTSWTCFRHRTQGCQLRLFPAVSAFADCFGALMISAGDGLSHAAVEFCFDIDALTLLENRNSRLCKKVVSVANRGVAFDAFVARSFNPCLLPSSTLPLTQFWKWSSKRRRESSSPIRGRGGEHRMNSHVRKLN